jgi:hypothetical protein
MSRNILLLLCAIPFFISCNKHNDAAIYEQGRLEYKITYLNAEEDHYDVLYLPKKMILQFNQDFSINQIDGFMGVFKLGNMTYFKNNRVKTYLKVLDKDYAFLGGRHDMMCCFDYLDGMILEEDTATYILAGLKSKRVNISFKDGREPFSIYYTNEIDLARPNSTNPYQAVNGVLTHFRLTMGPYLMEFRATKFDPEKPPKSEMEIPAGALEVTRPQMVAILNRLMEQNL